MYIIYIYTYVHTYIHTYKHLAPARLHLSVSAVSLHHAQDHRHDVFGW